MRHSGSSRQGAGQDDQFNTLLVKVSRRNWPQDITLGVDDGYGDNDLPGSLEEGVYNDTYSCIRADGGQLALRHFLFTIDLPKPPQP